MGDYVLVPRVATAEMHRASVEDVPVYPAMGERWKAMLAARPPVDYEALAMELATAGAAYANAHPDASMIECMAQALREVLP